MQDPSVAMDDVKTQLLKEALDIIQKTKEGVLKGLEYAQAQIPDLIKQFLNWELTVGIILMIFGVIIFVVGWHLWDKALKKADKRVKELKETDGWDDATAGLALSGWVGMILGFPFLFFNLLKVAQIAVAPKLFLVKWLMANIPHSLPH